VQDSSHLHFHNCRFFGQASSLVVTGSDHLRVTHSEFTGFQQAAIDLQQTGQVFLSGNVFDNARGTAVRTDSLDAMDYSDYNSYARADRVWQVADRSQSLADLQRQPLKPGTPFAAVGPAVSQRPQSTGLAEPRAFRHRRPDGQAVGRLPASRPVRHQPSSRRWADGSLRDSHDGEHAVVVLASRRLSRPLGPHRQPGKLGHAVAGQRLPPGQPDRELPYVQPHRP
jgi:hypothetical protein